ncbi:hypothetical protein L226DRAFT_573668 [Lentinus tigrinus ALCF2SS1-7]|uniref:uncharacterized protein n=1 Tax=Lentinus tigrinus ALCF2SS1-7 TaxID=1328758 RepID=UPI001165EEFA|nr:hypothetical protein L226DRAFT_573668 [Lentinus tigrinus ALCF2SS1-7]
MPLPLFLLSQGLDILILVIHTQNKVQMSFQGNLLILARIFSKAGSGRGVIKLKDLSSSLTATGCEMQRGKGRMTRLLPPPELAKAAVTFSAPSNGDVSKATQAFIRRQIVAKWGVGFEFFAARL